MAVALLAESNAWDPQRKDFWFTALDREIWQVTFQLGGQSSKTSRSRITRLGLSCCPLLCHSFLVVLPPPRCFDFFQEKVLHSPNKNGMHLASRECFRVKPVDQQLLASRSRAGNWTFCCCFSIGFLINTECPCFHLEGAPFFFVINDVSLGSMVTLQLRLGKEVMLCYQAADQPEPTSKPVAVSHPRVVGGSSPECLEPLVLVCDANAWTPETLAAFVPHLCPNMANNGSHALEK